MAIFRWPLALIIALILLFVTYTGIRALIEAYDSSGFPEALAIKVELLPVIFPVHMVTGGLTLLLVPATIFARRTRWHKTLGRITALMIIISGLTAPIVAWQIPVTLISAAGFTAQALAWMGLLTAGIWNIRNGRIKAHQTYMLMVAAVTSGAIFFRIYLGLYAHYGPRGFFYYFYGFNAWIAWLLPLIVVYVLTRPNLVRQLH